MRTSEADISALRQQTEAIVRKARRLKEKLSSQASWYVVFATALVSVIFPVVEAALTSPQFNTQPATWIVVFISHTIASVFTLRGVSRLRELETLLDVDKFDDVLNSLLSSENLLDEQNEELSAEIERAYSQLITVMASLSFLYRLSTLGGKANSVAVGELLDPLVKNRVKALGFDDSEAMYSISVYLFDRDTNTLKLHWRSCDDRIERRDRSWSPGLGHIGIAYAQNEILILKDAGKEGIPELIAHSDDPERDLRYYRSYMSIAVPNKEGTGSIGVLTISSSKAEQFNDSFKPLCEAYRLLISLYFTHFSNGD